jgi:GNAT superfamily N-acetyltransferase
MPIDIRPARTPAEVKAFAEFPWTLYRDDPNWVPPLLSMRHDLFDKAKNPAWDYLRGEYFTALRDGRIVGTIGAVVNPRHNEFHHENIAWFGAFECEDDPEAATALLNTAVEWARAQGVTAIRGPQTFTTHEETGLLVDNFSPPILLMPYNKPYYERLILGAGFQPVLDTHSFILTGEEARAGLFDRLRRITQSIMKRSHITVRGIDKTRLKQEFVLFKELYNTAWDANWGFVPMTARELDALVASLGQFFDPRLAFFAEVDGVPAGFILTIPDFNQVLAKAKARPGVPEWVSLLRALWYWKVRPVMTWARVPLMGVKPEFRGKGVDAVLYFHALEALLDAGFEYGDCGWILSTNEQMMSIAKNFGARIYKTYRYYERAV